MKKEVFLIAISASIALGANNQKDLDLINASAAYDQGITGSGVKIGVIDGAAKTDVRSLKDKVKEQKFSKYRGSTYTPDYTVDTHGTHVTSIIVGNNLGNNAPHGVAYGATSYNLQVTGRNTTGSNSDIEVPSPDKIYSYFMDNGVSVINNSWNSKIYPLVGMDGEMTYHPLYISTDANSWIEQAFYKSKEIKSLVQISEENKALVVFAAGNEGMSSPGIFATLPSYNEKLRSFLVVGAVDSNEITKNGDKLELKGISVPLFSNGFKGSTNYALMAPGNNVVAANAAYGLRDVLGKTDKNEFIAISGTSQATPYVSGAAALVQEKFPFLKPNQVADVLLSTANQNFKKPKAIVKKTTSRGLNDNKTLTYGGYTVYHDGNSKGPVSGNWFSGGFPRVGGNGVMEIGKYIDFHNANNGTEDYSVRLCVDANNKNTVYLPNDDGRLYNTGNHGCKRLANGAWHMNGNQSVNLSDTVWNQAHGIVLVFSAYNPSSGQAYNFDWHTYFVPKTFFTDRESAEGYALITTFLTNPTLTNIGTKHIRVYNNRVTGDDRNIQSGSGSGISFRNTEWVLRYVYGV